MSTTFWEIEHNLKEIFKDIQTDNPKATLWDLFNDYTPFTDDREPANTSEEWLAQQAKFVDDIVSEHFANMPLNRASLDLIMDAISDRLFPEDNPDHEPDPDEKQYQDLAKSIIEKYITPHNLNENTQMNFLDALEDKLEVINKEQILKDDKEEMRALIQANYPEDQVEEMLKNLESSWEMDPEDDEEIEQDALEADAFDFPQMELAYSDSFFGIDDAGDLPFEEQERLAQDKYASYQNDISELLGQQPDVALQPKDLHALKVEEEDVDWGKYYSFFDANPFAYVIDGTFLVWRGKNEVLFLSMKKEDKELPYSICLGGLSLEKYMQVLNAYNEMVESL